MLKRDLPLAQLPLLEKLMKLISAHKVSSCSLSTNEPLHKVYSRLIMSVKVLIVSYLSSDRLCCERTENGRRVLVKIEAWISRRCNPLSSIIKEDKELP